MCGLVLCTAGLFRLRAVLITVYGATGADAGTPEHVFIAGIRHGFRAATIFLAVSALVAGVLIRTAASTRTP